jgi:hypothetical protein
MSTNTRTSINVHVNGGEITGAVEHQQHERSGGRYPVIGLELGGFSFTIYPGRDQAVEMADALYDLAVELRAGAERFAVQSLAD